MEIDFLSLSEQKVSMFAELNRQVIDYIDKNLILETVKNHITIIKRQTNLDKQVSKSKNNRRELRWELCIQINFALIISLQLKSFFSIKEVLKLVPKYFLSLAD